MRVKKEDVIIDIEVILFNEEKVLLLGKGEVQAEFLDKQFFPLYTKGRLIEFQMGYQGEYYKSYVVGRNKLIIAFGHILDDMDDTEIMRAIESNDIQYETEGEESNKILLYIK